jgi:release factor glutamine methyltransferase
MSLVTVAELLDEAARKLRAAGVVKPRREANRLWAWQHRRNPGDTWFARGEPAEADGARSFLDAVERRVRGEPLAYILGHVGFRRLEIRCDRRALIPRPETEGLVERALRRVPGGAALDVGTGTGCLALALRDEGGFQVTAVDRSEAALELARENARATGLEIELVPSDLGTALAGRRYDLLVANPPYLTEAEYEGLDPSVKAWEPRDALVSGVDGLEHTRRILRECGALVRPGGWIVMELDSTRSSAVARLACEAGWDAVEIEPDLFGRARYLSARRAPHLGGGQ